MIPEHQATAPHHARSLALRFSPIAVALAALIILVAIWPHWVLAYGRVFAWPLIVGAVAIAFRREIAGLFSGRGLREAHLPGGGRLIFAESPDRPQPSLDPKRDAAFVVHAGEPEPEQGEPLDELALAQAESTDALEGLATMYAFTQLFAIQLDFLLHLRSATPDGLTPLASEEWFRAQLESRPQFVPGVWDPAALISWLIRNGFLRVQENGNYDIEEMGHRILWLVDQNYWYAPKLF